MSTQHTSSASVVPQWQQLVAPAAASCHQRRSWQRLQLLGCGLLSALGRHTLSQVITTLGAGDADWSAWYRVFNQERIAWETAQKQLAAAVGQQQRPADPYVVGLDATHLPRTSATMPGVGWARQPRTPPGSGASTAPSAGWG